MLKDFALRLMADYIIIPIVLVGGAAMLRVPKDDRYQLWMRAIFAALVALLIAKGISLLYQGQRPFETLGVQPGAAFLPNPGFPSDHALLVFVVTCVVWASYSVLPSYSHKCFDKIVLLKLNSLTSLEQMFNGVTI